MRNSWILTEHHIAFDFIIGMFNFIQGKPGPTPHLHSSSNIDYQISSFETFFNHDIWDDGVHLSVIQQVLRYILIYLYVLYWADSPCFSGLCWCLSFICIFACKVDVWEWRLTCFGAKRAGMVMAPSWEQLSETRTDWIRHFDTAPGEHTG